MRRNLRDRITVSPWIFLRTLYFVSRKWLNMVVQACHFSWLQFQESVEWVKRLFYCFLSVLNFCLTFSIKCWVSLGEVCFVLNSCFFHWGGSVFSLFWLLPLQVGSNCDLFLLMPHQVRKNRDFFRLMPHQVRTNCDLFWLMPHQVRTNCDLF